MSHSVNILSSHTICFQSTLNVSSYLSNLINVDDQSSNMKNLNAINLRNEIGDESRE